MIYKKSIDRQIINWHCDTIQRYTLIEDTMNIKILKFFNLKENKKIKDKKQENITKAHLNHTKLWDKIKTITLHITSKKLLFYNEHYTAFYKCFCCCGQSPQMIKSKKAIDAFKVMKGLIVGAQSNLRGENARAFCYKWAFLAPELASSQLMMSHREQFYISKQKESTLLVQHSCIGVDNVFVFPELDKLNYYLFETIPGFDLTICYKPTKETNSIPKSKS